MAGQQKTLMIKKLFIRPTDSTLIQLFGYTFVGGMAFTVDFTLLFVLTDILSIYYLISAAIAFLLGLTTNYILSIIWVFRRQSKIVSTIFVYLWISLPENSYCFVRSWP